MTEKQDVVETECVENKTYDVLIEEKRAPLYNQFIKSRKISNILTFVILIISIGGMLLIVQPGVWQVIGWCLLGAGFVSMICFYIFSKKKFDGNTQNYLNFINETLNNQTFSGKNYSEIVKTDGKLEINDFVGNGVYNDIVRVVSRNVVTGKYKETCFKFAEAALFKKTDNKRQAATAAFVGKFFETANSIKYGGNIVINISRDEPVDAPNALDSKTKLYNQDGLTIYGDEGTDLFYYLLKVDSTGDILATRYEYIYKKCKWKLIWLRDYCFCFKRRKRFKNN